MTLALEKRRWKRVALGDVAFASKEKVEPSSGEVERYVAGEHMDTDDLKVHRWGEIGDGYLGPAFHRRFRPGQVLYGSRRTYLRKVAVADFEGVTANTTFVVDTKDDELLLQAFLPFIMSSEPFHKFAVSESRGSVNPYVNWSDIERYEFALPPTGEQKRLAELLWSTERARRAVAATSRASEIVAEAYLSSVFAEQPSASVPVPEMVDDMKVGIVVKPAQYYTDDTEQGVPALRGVNVVAGAFDLTDLVYFRPESARSLTKSTLRAGDVVVVRTGRPGDAAVVTEQVSGYNCIDLIIARPSSRLVPEFLARYLNSRFGRAQITKNSVGTAQQHFNIGALKRLEMPYLSLDSQRAVIAKADQIDSVTALHRSEHTALRELRYALLNSIFGEGS